MNHLGQPYIKNPVGETRDIYMDDVINVSANLTNKAAESLHLDDKSWEKVYNKLIEVLEEVCGNPEYRSYL